MAAQSEQEINLIKNLLTRFEKHPVVDTTKTPEIPKDIQSYMEKVETLADLSAPPIVISQNGNPSPSAQKPTIILPLTPTQFSQAGKSGIFDSVRWLAAWCFRLIKIYGSRATFRQEPNL